MNPVKTGVSEHECLMRVEYPDLNERFVQLSSMQTKTKTRVLEILPVLFNKRVKLELQTFLLIFHSLVEKFTHNSLDSLPVGGSLRC